MDGCTLNKGMLKNITTRFYFSTHCYKIMFWLIYNCSKFA